MKYSARIVEVVSLGIILAGFAGYNFMFADAPASPPANNVAAPLNTGSTPQSKSAGLDLGSLTVQGGSIFKTTPTISNTAPTLKFEDTTPDARDFWWRTDGDVMYLLADRNDDDVWTGENPWPLAVKVGASSADDYAVFSNEVRATEYCDRQGNNCFSGETAVNEPTVQYFEVSGGPGVTSNVAHTGSGWTMCALSKQKTTARDDNMFDGCEVRKESDGNWNLYLTKHTEDSLTCGATCFSIDENPDAGAPIVYSYAWKTGSWGGFGACSFGGGTYTQTRSVSCTRDDNIVVADSFCGGGKPSTTQVVARPMCHEKPE